jgi:transcription elongation factor GreA
MSKIPMTVTGVEALREELHRLKTETRPRIVQAISEAREKGDLRENAEYHAAKEEQGFSEGRIQQIESKLASAQIIDVTTIAPSGRVVFGSTVKLLNLEDDSEVMYQIVGEDEADVKLSKISIHSPIARALIGKELSDIAVVTAPNGEIEYEIKAIDHR